MPFRKQNNFARSKKNRIFAGYKKQIMRIPSNRISDIERFTYSELDGLYPKGEIRCFLGMIFEEFLGWDRVTWLTSKNKTVNQSDLLKINFAIKDLTNCRPIQYVLGKTLFCGITLSVDENVLIPRPETEEIVNRAVGLCVSPQDILDLCTGSGCLAIALAKAFPKSSVTAVDISEKALGVARKNAADNGADICFRTMDISSKCVFDGKFGLIVSNPPYVRNSEKSSMHANVLDYEPPEALFVDDADPLCFYRYILDIARDYLTPDGLLIVEINEALGTETESLFRENGFETSLLKDFNEKDRFVLCHNKNR